ncbi:nuclear transport factor 2 family protein [Sphingorhabdus sp.]|uniref:YybH family protein n=1 Tax=Sphingorhabdus sp. TaxID=1902408 RepID=UPI002631D15C|nr:nuclear transport factor 2 family protein [Sphingorhabdus sp.]MDH4398590.1 nuclear transport factor 2 family protein [Sphingorhabdus sp.]
MGSLKRRAAIAPLVSCLAMLASCANVEKPITFNAPADLAAIKLIETTMATETNMDKLIGYYADDATVLDVYAPGIYKGRDQIYAGFAPQMAAIQSMTHRVAEMNVATNGNFACAASQIEFDAVLNDGKKMSLSVRQLDAFKKIGNEWKIVQQHISLPIDPKSGAAIIDGPVNARGGIAWSKDPLPGPASTPEEAKAAIRTWMDVGGASTSLDMLMGYYGPGEDILVYDSFASNLRGMKEVRAHYAAIMNSYTDIKLEMPNFVVDSDGVFGVQLDTQRITLSMKDGSTQKLALRQSDCMRKSGDKWYSFLEHLSFAVDPKTGQGVVSF